MLPARPAQIALTTVLTLSLTAGALAGPIQLGLVRLDADAQLKVTNFPTQPPIPALSDHELEVWERPGPFLAAGGVGGNAQANADVVRQAPFTSQLIYSAAVQSSIANAVAVTHSYDAAALTTSLEAKTSWIASVKNLDDTPLPVMFSFFLSGGGITAFCAVCASPLTAELEARIDYSRTMLPPVSWKFNAKLSWPSALAGPTLTTSGSDPFGIGLPVASILSMPSAADSFIRIGIDPFQADAFNLGDLDPFLISDPPPQKQASIQYTMSARISSVGSAFATAWLTDPFDLGEAPGSLPSSGFAINGESIESLLAVTPTAPGVPVPGTLLLLITGLAGFASRFTTRRGHSGKG